ncbi:CoA pyrophosphatase [Vogesella oryzae]|uniref:CoA pyrophosphatase n=1 Tax=Vogesella oryzae TaxID=1735285 RepID=UPI0015817240|nr:CoA pyrophosphatase [Vogesella oryzae]
MNLLRDAEQMAGWLAGFAGLEVADEEGLGLRQVPAKSAAVLVAVHWHADDWHILLTRRTPHLRSHAGQISFPGGRIEAEDGSAEVAALREAEEEVGLPPALVRVVATLPHYDTVTGYRVTPVLALLTAPFQPRPSPHEVAEVFSLPLVLALDEAVYERQPYVRDGVAGHYYVLRYGDYFIWGATAAMLRRLARHHAANL